MPKRFFIRKAKVMVQVQMSDGVTIKGHVFINIDARVLDLLNDSSAFIPFEAEDGGFHLLNKFEILRLTPLGHRR